VKYEHGYDVPFPIARAADESGNLHLFYGVPDFEGEPEDAIYSRAFFTDRYELSEQMFALIDEGFLRAASIHVLPAEGCWRPMPGYSLSDEDFPIHAMKSSMLEWSVCTVQVNPDSYCKSLSKDSGFSKLLNLQLESANRILERGTLATRRLLPSIAKCLKSVKPPKQPIVKGASIESSESNEMKKSMSEAEVAKLAPLALAKAVASAEQFDADTVKLLRSRAKSYEDGTDPMQKASCDDGMQKADDASAVDLPTETEETPEVEATSSVSPGADFLAALHSSVADMISKLESAQQATEKPEVLDFASQFADTLRQELATIEGAYASTYPEAPALTTGDSEPVDAEMVKSWVADNTKRGYQLEGLATRLAKAAGDPKKLKSAVSTTIRDLRLLHSSAKSWKPAAKSEGVSKEEFAKLCGMVDKLADVVGKLPKNV
jgi:hypothetical protein